MVAPTAAEQWKLDKWGMFSASEMHKLCIGGKKDKNGNQDMFGQGAMTYISKIARQAYTIFNEREEVETMAMRMGKIDEAQAFQHLFMLLRMPELQYYGGANPIFKKYCSDSGASPDVLDHNEDGSISFGADLKCPTGDVYFDYLTEIKNSEDLKEKAFDYWVQQQFSMMAFNCNLWLWCPYNEYFPMSERMIIIEVKADKNWQDNMNLRLKQAVKLKYQEIEKRKSRNIQILN